MGIQYNESNNKNKSTTKVHISNLGLHNPDYKIDPGYKYDPYDHRQVANPTTTGETLFNLVKGCMGTGILAMPKAFLHSGYIGGTIGMFIVGFVCTYCVKQLVDCAYELCRRKRVPSLTYRGVVEAAVKEGPQSIRSITRFAPSILTAFLLAYQVGTGSVYVLFIAANIKKICDIYIDAYDIRLYMTMILIPLIRLSYVKSLKELAVACKIANVFALGGFGIIMYYVFFTAKLSVEGRETVGSVQDVSLFFGTVLFALANIGVILPMENSMENPKKFTSSCGVLNLGMGAIVVLYFAMGVLGYLAYGSDVEGTITLNLNQDHTSSDIPAQVAQLLMTLSVFVSYGLQCYVSVDIVWTEYLGAKMEVHPKKIMYKYVVQTSLVLLTYLMAVVIPNLDLFISLIGSLTLSVLGVIAPAAIHTFTFWYTTSGARFWLMMLQNVLITLFGLAGMVIGTSISVRDIISTFF